MDFMGLALLFLLGALTIFAVLCAAIVHDARHPTRATAGWALGRGLPIDPGELGLNFVTRGEGTALPRWEVEGRDPQGVVTILIHGWRRSRIDSLRRIHPWIDVSRTLWLIDLPGHGDAHKGPTTLGIGDAELIEREIDTALASSLNDGAAPRILLVGHSMGAVVAADLARRLPPQRLAGLVAFAPYSAISEPLTNRLRCRALPATTFAWIASLLLRTILGQEPDTGGALTLLRARGIPILIVAARDDHTVGLEHVRSLARRAGHKVVISTHASHDALGAGLQSDADPPSALAAAVFARQIQAESRANATSPPQA